MTHYLLLSIRFLDSRYHGLRDRDGPREWPPSPFRVFQALIAGNARGSSISKPVLAAFRWLESLPPPHIITPQTQQRYMALLTYVPNNQEDGSRTPKKILPTLLLNDDRLIQYAWTFDPTGEDAMSHSQAIIHASHRIQALGWGIDLAIGHGEVVKCLPQADARRVHYEPCTLADISGFDLRTPCVGSLESLQERYADVLRRAESHGITQLESAAVIYERQAYVSTLTHPYVVFELRNDDDSFYRHRPSHLTCIASMVRHLAIELMTERPPQGVDADWVDTYIAGHARSEANGHRQISYLPLCSIGTPHTDPGVRRVMIAAPLGDDRWLNHLATRLEGQRLRPEPHTKLGSPPTLVRAQNTAFSRFYTRPAVRWASVTPVILPGHDDRKPAKTRRLIEKTLRQSGIEQPCEFEWSAFSYFPKLLSAHKYDRQNRPAGYFKPKYLRELTAVHLTLRFKDDLKAPGPLAIGAGRHCGLGLMACIDP